MILDYVAYGLVNVVAVLLILKRDRESYFFFGLFLLWTLHMSFLNQSDWSSSLITLAGVGYLAFKVKQSGISSRFKERLIPKKYR